MDHPEFDVVILGAGTAGIPCAITAADGGARVLLVDRDDRAGGTLHVSGGHLTAGGTRRQRERGIEDDPDRHYDDVMRIGLGAADPVLLRRAVELAPSLVDWLDELGMQQADDSPRIVHGHEPYRIARTHYGRDEARSILTVIEPLLQAHIAAGRVTAWLSTSARSLVRRHARVTGAMLDRDGELIEVRARDVVVATGGYASNPELFEQLEGLDLHSSAPASATGDGLVIAREVGAAIVREGYFIPTFGGLPDPDRPGGTQWLPRPRLVATERPPWEIYVGNDGRRFVAEDELSIDVKERRLLEHAADLTFHLVIDQRGLREGAPLLLGAPTDAVETFANRRPGFVAADDLPTLAALAGIDADVLVRTVATYNDAVRTGAPDALGRTHRPAPLDEPPFHAIRNHGATLITFGGLDVDGSFRVRDTDGEVIPGLYAVGEVIGAGATMGRAFCGGMTLTPALAFGRDLGQRLATSARA